MTMEDDIRRVLADGAITPDESPAVVEMLRILGSENAELRLELKSTRVERDEMRERMEASHDSQMRERDGEIVRIILSTIAGLAVVAFGVFVGMDMELLEIGVNLLPFGGTMLATYAIAYFKRYLGRLTPGDGGANKNGP